MTRSAAVLATLAVYIGIMALAAFWAAFRTRDKDDFFLGGRALGPWIAALSASASSSSAWTLLGVSGAAYAWGLKAIWLLPSILLGYAVNWFWVGPRLQRSGHESGALTLTEWLVEGQDPGAARSNARLATLIVLVSFLFYVAAQLNAAGHAFSVSLNIDPLLAVSLGAAVVLVYTLSGGFWAVSATDSVQGLVMLGVSLMLPVLGLLLVGGFDGLLDGLDQSISGGAALAGDLPVLLAVAFVVGIFGIGLGYPGQPHVVNRYLALRDVRALRRARWIAIVWISVVLTGMLLLGWSARVLFGDSIDNPEQSMFEFAFRLLAPAMAGVVVAAVLSAIMSTADSQLLVAASSLAHDWNLPQRGSTGLLLIRSVVCAVTLIALALAVFLPEPIFSRVLFAWHALGSAFGPLVILRVLGRQIEPRAMFLAMAVGFGGTVVLHWLPDTSGDWAERLLPLLLCATVAGWGSRSAQH